MPIGSEEQQKIMNHLQGRNNKCPVCGTNNWMIFEDLVSPLCIDIEYKRAIEGKFLPVIEIICNDCGYVWQIAAVKIGLLI